jgi:protein-S-isoprenylcysteine O-methyltransferase Ste14
MINYFASLGMCLLGLAIRTSYELLKKAGKANAENPFVFAVVAAAMGLMLASWPILCSSDPTRLVSSDIMRPVGQGVWIVGLGLALGALIQLRGVDNIDHLVTTGLFSRLRHPMYLGFIFWIIGWVIYSGALVSLVAGLVGIGNILFWRQLEEEQLGARYGERYQEYRQGTWF